MINRYLFAATLCSLLFSRALFHYLSSSQRKASFFALRYISRICCAMSYCTVSVYFTLSLISHFHTPHCFSYFRLCCLFYFQLIFGEALFPFEFSAFFIFLRLIQSLIFTLLYHLSYCQEQVIFMLFIIFSPISTAPIH